MLRFRGRPNVVASIAALLGGLVLAGRSSEAHKPVTSPYTYNEDVFPIVRDRCGRCHVAGGVAPMSLMTYKDAYPWGESIRTELIAGHMPPWGVDGATARLKNAHGLTARELNVLLTWATGGNPIGKPENTPAPVAARDGWPLGPPDLTLKLPPFSLTAETQTQTLEFTVPTGLNEERWIRAVDLLPETRAIVRSATVTAGSGSIGPRKTENGTAAERVLALWLPGEDPVPPSDGAFRLPAGADLVVRVHYKKTWEYERKEMTDRSTVGLYFAPSPAKDVRALVLAPAGVAGNVEQSVAFSAPVSEDLRALAVYPDPRLSEARVQLHAVRPDGSRIELIRFQPLSDWTRRYWFEQPITLPRGSRIEIAVSFNQKDTLLPPGAAPLSPKPPDPDSIRLTLNVVGESR